MRLNVPAAGPPAVVMFRKCPLTALCLCEGQGVIMSRPSTPNYIEDSYCLFAYSYLLQIHLHTNNAYFKHLHNIK